MKTYLLYPTEDQEKMIQTFLEANNIEFFEEKEDLPPHVIAGIQRGQKDIAAGRTITLDEFKRRFFVNK